MVGEIEAAIVHTAKAVLSAEANEVQPTMAWALAREVLRIHAPAASARGVADGWKPIETCNTWKHDHMHPMLAFWQSIGRARETYWDEDEEFDERPEWWKSPREGWRSPGDQCIPVNQESVTHWMPLPSLSAAPSSPAATPEVERDWHDALVEKRRYLLLSSYCGGEGECTDYRPCNDCLAMCNIFRVADAEPEYIRQLGEFRTPPPPAGEECLRMIASMIPRTSAQAYWFHVAADIVGLPHIEMEQDIPAENDVERVAEAIRDIKGGLNYDYMDFCRDAARAAIAAMPESFTTGFNAGRDAAAEAALEFGDHIVSTAIRAITPPTP